MRSVKQRFAPDSATLPICNVQKSATYASYKNNWQACPLGGRQYGLEAGQFCSFGEIAGDQTNELVL